MAADTGALPHSSTPRPFDGRAHAPGLCARPVAPVHAHARISLSGGPKPIRGGHMAKAISLRSILPTNLRSLAGPAHPQPHARVAEPPPTTYTSGSVPSLLRSQQGAVEAGMEAPTAVNEHENTPAARRPGRGPGLWIGTQPSAALDIPSNRAPRPRHHICTHETPPHLQRPWACSPGPSCTAAVASPGLCFVSPPIGNGPNGRHRPRFPRRARSQVRPGRPNAQRRLLGAFQRGTRLDASLLS